MPQSNNIAAFICLTCQLLSMLGEVKMKGGREEASKDAPEGVLVPTPLLNTEHTHEASKR